MSVTRTAGQKLKTDPALPPVAVVEPISFPLRQKILFLALGIIGAVAWFFIATLRGENVSAVWFVLAAVCTYLVALRFYATLIERKIHQPDDTRATPAEEFANGRDFEPTNRSVLFGHHFAAIAGAGPLVGPVLATQMGYLPGTIWIIVGVVLAGAVQDYMVLHLSIRRRGRSLGQMAHEELGTVGGWFAIVGVFTIMIILIAVLAIVIIGALASSPWGVFSIAMTIPIAFLMGVYMRFIRPGKVGEASVIGIVLLVLAIAGGSLVNGHPQLSKFFTLSPVELAFAIAIYGFMAAILPVWLLLAPRDYLSTFMKVGTIVFLALAILIVLPVMQMPAVTKFALDGTGPAFAGNLFPFLFITIACGALSGFHSLIASGTTPKMIQKESQARLIGYGGMLTESFVAISALITAAVIDQHLYFGMNAPLALTGGTPETVAAYTNGLHLVSGAGMPLPDATAAQFAQAASEVGEKSIISRTGGAPTLAFGMAHILSQIPIVGAAKAFWYHFAVMFEALFILTTVDAGTRVARFMLSDSLANIPGWQRFRDPSWRPGAWLCTAIVVTLWGSIVVMGVTDPLGGINMLFPLFGIANQLLAAIALTVVFVVVMKKGLFKWAWIPGLPLAWDLFITMWASWQKIFSPNPKIGYWSLNAAARQARAAGAQTFQGAKTPDQIDMVIRNTAVQGTLSILYAGLVLIVFLIGMRIAIRAVQKNGLPTSEAEGMPSKIFAPSSFVPTRLEKEVLAEWQAAGIDPSGDGRLPGMHHTSQQETVQEENQL
ncbi:carbon starvation protein [Raineyella antarctica]|uniref:Carbon starvation protein n=1 Tax=Raineyella antarctica TaxID=1577474 RepID=A0A1G6H7X0_9ACTN|nr:carbon starvation CstA family protein [Raineyella antarctica]SDB90244.1 carbon starvation protein [Raineyella antarctica]